LGAGVWAQGHLGAGRLDEGRFGAVLIKNRHNAMEARLMRNHSTTELEARFMLIKYASLSETEVGHIQ